MTGRSPFIVESQARDVDLHKTLVRIISGGVGEGIDRLKALTAEFESADHDLASVEVVPIATNPVAMALIGWVSELPEQVKAARSTAQQLTYPMIQLFGVAYSTAAVVAEATGITGIVSSLTEPTRQLLVQELDRLSKVGAAEYTRGRVLSVQAFERSVGGIVGYLAESDELGELVREQTIGITGAAVQEIRETGAAADGLAEGILRKLLGRESRPLPPVPAVEHS
jgi:hypothetical protein